MFMNTFLWWCANWYYYLLNLNYPEVQQFQEIDNRQGNVHDRFEIAYQWNYLNYTWESPEQYNQAIQSGKYIPANNAPTGIKFYQNLMFLTVPRFRQGIPSTLVYLDQSSTINYHNPLLTPYPNWQINDDTISCATLQSIQSMEVDTKGIMWIIDGVRINNYARCPSKLVLLDLNNGGTLIRSYVFPNNIARQNGGFLNDIVVDQTDGDFAYISDNSGADPGIIVYSRRKNTSWKLRDMSMQPEPKAAMFSVENIIFDTPTPVDGIALSPTNQNGDNILYYCAISSFKLYSLRTSAIKNKLLVETGAWKRNIKLEGDKMAQSDGIIIDENSNMYLTMMALYGVAFWNIRQSISTMSILDSNRKSMLWTDGFAFDQQGFLYLINNKVYNYIDLRRTPSITSDTPFKILKIFTGTRSYLYG